MKHIISKFVGLGLALWVSAGAHAKPSVNDVQQCQAVIDFTIERVSSVKKYDKVDVDVVVSGLKTYEAFLQSEHVDPGLLVFTNGDKAAAKDFQTQIDTFKGQMVTGLKARHPQAQIFTDQAVAINNCYSAAPMGADKTEMMKTALETIIKLAKQG